MARPRKELATEIPAEPQPTPEMPVVESKPIAPPTPAVQQDIHKNFMRDATAEERIIWALRKMPVKQVDALCSSNPEVMPSHLDIVVEGGLRVRIEGHFTVVPIA